MDSLFWFIPLASVIVLATARGFFRQMKDYPMGSEKMQAIADSIRQGAMAYLRQQYKVVGSIFLLLALLLAYLCYGLHLQSRCLPFAFLSAGFFSSLAGFLGMRTATHASARTAFAASQSLNDALRIAFRSGAVMGLVVVGLGLLDYSLWFFLLHRFIDADSPQQKLLAVTSTMLTFGIGTSLQALFARVGGGIFTKAADVGADLVGKMEANIPEDDPRNPAAIADNVGDNVGDVAGMGADLYESFYGSILAATALGAAAFYAHDAAIQIKATLLPALIGALGSLLSIGGILAVRTRENADMHTLLRSLGRGIRLTALLIAVLSFALLYFLKIPNYLGLWGALVVGLITGEVIGKSSEYYTSQAYRPTRRIAQQASTSAATGVISGIGIGMISTVIPVTAVVIGTALAFGFATQFDPKEISLGLFGISIAAVGMLSTLGITLATDAYGPIADNAGGNAEMSQLSPEVRRRTDALDALGNTTAATGKGFAIGSAALTALALMASYVEGIRVQLLQSGTHVLSCGHHLVHTVQATLGDFMQLYDVQLMNPHVLLGLFVGSMMAFLFCGLTINAVGRAAASIVNEVRRQFREIAGILEGKTPPDYARCVTISTRAAQREMILPSLSAVLAPILMGYAFGVPGVLGLLSGALSTGFALAIFMANSGGAWDNAKKYIEEGAYGGKGSPAHKSAIIGDTIGDPFKDTSGPSLNILIKLMSMIAIVTVGLTVGHVSLK
ncbi:MAG: sodium-translocating pyrophosphatase [Puniceicoccales bacterium]|jgi:K(+)-stimulated pyrophosphate-energized sodium pump|nr:sodium-translocating pyrophosphatase [Puniceicoccales bacterium]